MLAVVQDQQQLPGAEGAQHGVQSRSTRLLRDRHRRQDRVGHQRRVSQRRQLDEPDAIRKSIQLPGRDLQREAALAHPARPREGEQARGREQFADRSNVSLATDKARQFAWQVLASFVIGGGRLETPAPPDGHDGGQEAGTLVRCQLKRGSQALGRVAVRNVAGAAFEVGNSTPTEPCPFGEGLLRQTGCRAIAAQQRSKAGRSSIATLLPPIRPSAYPTGAH